MLQNNGLRRKKRSRGAVNPLESVANLVDVMLVFACGLMVSIIMFWQVDLDHVVDLVDESELVEVDELEEAIEDGSFSNEFNSKGIVYEDPETGKMYIVMP